MNKLKLKNKWLGFYGWAIGSMVNTYAQTALFSDTSDKEAFNASETSGLFKMAGPFLKLIQYGSWIVGATLIILGIVKAMSNDGDYKAVYKLLPGGAMLLGIGAIISWLQKGGTK